MKRFVLLSAMIISITMSAIAQDDAPQKRDGGRLEALKIAYLTKQLNLTTEEAQKFWPVYNKYIGEMRQLKQPNVKMDELELEEKAVAIRKKYKNDFTQILPGGDRVNRFYKADREFNMMLQREMMERRQLKMDRKPKSGGLQ